METLSEYVLIARQVNQCILIESDITPLGRIPPPTTKDKVFYILRIIGIILLSILGIVLVGVAIWGIILEPWLIIFFFLGLLMPLGR